MSDDRSIPAAEDEEFLRTLVRSLPNGSVNVFDRSYRYIFAAGRGFARIGLTAESLIGKTIAEVYGEDVAAFVRPFCEQAFAGEDTTFDVDLDHTTWTISAAPIVNANGDARALLAVAQDVTDRRRTEQALVLAERRAARDYEALLERVARLAESFGMARSLATVFGALRDFALVSTPADTVSVSFYDEASERRSLAYEWRLGTETMGADLAGMPSRGEPGDACEGGLEHSENDAIRTLSMPMAVQGRVIGCVTLASDTAEAFDAGHATALRLAANLAAIAVENVRMFARGLEREERLVQAQKMEAVGRLAGGIAHDFNNLLTVINGFSDFVLARLGERDEVREDVVEIKRAGDRAAGLTRQLLAFSRRQILRPKNIDLAEIATGVARMLERVIGEDIRLHLKTFSARTEADPGQMEQVLLNLALNARDAMPDGGALTIETRAATPDEALRAAHADGSRGGGYVALVVTDTGRGMDSETLARIFEPFFTTSETGKGTGLGLATVYGIVRQTGGELDVVSTPGRGSTFSVYLPAAGPRLVASLAAPAAELPHPGTGTILVVEDESMVRRLAVLALERQGYTVLQAASGEHALALQQARGTRIDLLLTDVVMPGMGGRELAQALQMRQPGLRVLFTSGYTDDEVFRRGVGGPGVSLLFKPFTPTELVQAIEAALAKTEAP